MDMELDMFEVSAGLNNRYKYLYVKIKGIFIVILNYIVIWLANELYFGPQDTDAWPVICLSYLLVCELGKARQNRKF